MRMPQAVKRSLSESEGDLGSSLGEPMMSSMVNLVGGRGPAPVGLTRELDGELEDSNLKAA